MRSVLFLLSALMIVVHPGCASAGVDNGSLVGKKAPDFKLERLKDGATSLQELRKSGKAIVFFWATWCPHCREQLKEVIARKEELSKQGIAVALVDIGEDAATVQKFLAAKGYDLNVFLDVNSSTAEIYQVVGVPSLFFVGADGVVRDMQYGFPTDYKEILK